MIHAHLIVNPAAGRGAAGRAADRVARAFRGQGWVVDLCRTEHPGHASELARARDLKEAMEIQQRFAERQMRSYTEQAQDLGRLMADVTAKK